MTPRSGDMRVVVCLALDEHYPFLLAPARLHNPQWITGGVRTLHELAVAAAAAGYETEVRGDFHGGVLDGLAAAAGVCVATPKEARRAESSDIVCVPDGIRDPTFFIRIALMRSTPVYLALAPPGLVGWSFTPDWRYIDALDVDPATVGLPEHCRAIDGLGFRVWSNAATTGGVFVKAGVPATVIGAGRPTPPPPVPDKDVDVVTIGDNRWAPVTRGALQGFIGSWRELPSLPHKALLAELGRGRVFVHLARVEGHSRLATEARLMGACCVGLSSNRFAVGFDDDAGGALVDFPEDVVGVVQDMLADADELSRRQERARANALAHTDWKTYVERVGKAIAAIDAEPDRRDAPWRAVAEDLAERERGLEARIERIRARRSLRVPDAVSRVVRRTGGRNG